MHDTPSSTTNMSELTKTKADRWILFLLPPIAITTIFCCYLATNYYLKPFSDPLNWLRFATNLKRTFHADVFPIVYPVYLNICHKILGDFYVFFCNLPLLAGMTALSAFIAFETLRGKAIEARWFAAIATACMIVGFDPQLQLRLLNPYRDPLAHVFLMGSVLLFLRYSQQPERKTWTLPSSGILLGLAYATREPSILILPLLFLAGLDAARGQRLNFTVRNVVIFSACLILGALPFLTQTYIVSGQFLLPAKSSGSHGYMPGFIPSQFVVNSGHAFRYLTQGLRPIVALSSIIGCVLVSRRRNHRLSLLLVAPTIGFTLLYLTYRVFVPRYFFTVVLFAAPLASYAIATGILALMRHSTQTKKQRIWHGATFAVPIILGGVLLICTQRAKTQPRLQLHAARELQRACQKAFEHNALVYSERNLRGCIEWFGHVDSIPVWLTGTNKQADVEEVIAHTSRQLASGRPVYAVDAPPHEEPGPTMRVLQQGFTLVPYGEPLAIHGLEAAKWCFPYAPHLYQIFAWTNATTATRVSLSKATSGLLAINIPQGGGTLLIDGKEHDHLREGGIQYVWISSTNATRTIDVELQGNASLPDTLDAWILPADTPLHFSFDADNTHHNRNLLSNTFLRPYLKTDPYACVLAGTGTMSIPIPWPHAMGAVLRGDIRQLNPRSDGTLRQFLLTTTNTRACVQFAVDQNQGEFNACLIPESHARTITLAADFGAPRNSAWRIGRMQLTPILKGCYSYVPLEIDSDALIVRSGFYGQERNQEGQPFRWTDGSGELHFVLETPCNLTMRIYTLALHPNSDQNAPESYITWNGHKLPVCKQKIDNRHYVLQCDIPASATQRNYNLVSVQSPTWKPTDFRTGTDNRTLGLPIYAISLASETGLPSP